MCFCTGNSGLSWISSWEDQAWAVLPLTAIFHGRKAGTCGLLEQKVRLLNYCLHLQWIMFECVLIYDLPVMS